MLGDHVPFLAKQNGMARSLGTDKMATGIVVPTLIHTPYPMSESLVELGILPPQYFQALSIHKQRLWGLVISINSRSVYKI